jgi:signal transduction histidine kinase
MSSERLLETINEIIEISKIESGEIPIRLIELDLVEFMDYIIALFKPEALKKGLELYFVKPCNDLSFPIITDRDKFESIFTNLIKNALKFTLNGCIEVGCDKNETELKFYVKDSGSGIPAEKLDVIFDRFVQADHPYTRSFEGSGLGLSIVGAYCKMLGGKIWVESEEKIGSTSLSLLTTL